MVLFMFILLDMFDYHVSVGLYILSDLEGSVSLFLHKSFYPIIFFLNPNYMHIKFLNIVP